MSNQLNPDYLYVDTCTTDDQMVNDAHLSRIHQVQNPLRMHANAGTANTNEREYLGTTLFWLDCMGIANVMPLKTLEQKYKVTYNSSQ